MDHTSSEATESPKPKWFRLETLPMFLSILQLILFLNFSGGEPLPSGSVLSFNYGWPLQFYKKSLKLGGGLEFQILSVLGDAVIGVLVIYGIWRVVELRIKYRTILAGNSENSKDSKPPRFHLITLMLMVQALSVLLYFNITPSHSPFLLNDARDNRVGWPAPLYNFTANAQMPARFSVTGLFFNMLVTYQILYAIWWICEKIIAMLDARKKDTRISS